MVVHFIYSAALMCRLKKLNRDWDRRMKCIRWFLLVVFTCVFTGCGGGGSSGGTGGSGGTSISIDKASLSFVAPIGESAPAQIVNVTFKGDGLAVGFAPGVPQPGWLVIQQDSATATAASFSISTNNFATLGTHTTSIRFVTGKADGTKAVFKEVSVTLNVRDSVHVDTPALTFDSVQLAAQSPKSQTVNVQSNNQSLQWTAKSDAEWLNVSPQSGSGNTTLSISTNRTELAAGTYTAAITVRDTNNIDAKILVTLNIQPRIVYAQKRGVGLVSTANIQKLDDKIIMVDSAQLLTPNWQATSNQSWLSISDISNNQISIHANADMLTNGIHFAKVNVTSIVDNKIFSESVNVGFYKTNELSEEGEIAQIGLYSSDYESLGLALAADPIRPYLYTTVKGSSLIRRFNIHTGDTDSPFPLIDDEQFSAITLSSDGDTLYAHSSVENRVYKLDLIKLSWSYFSFSGGFGNPSRVTELHPNGKSILLIHEGMTILDATSGAVLASQSSFGGKNNVSAFAVSGNQNVLYGIALGCSGCDYLLRYEINYNHLVNLLSIYNSHDIFASISNGRDVATNEDGSRVNTASGGYYKFPVFNYDSLNGLKYSGDWAGQAYPANVEYGANGILYAGLDSLYADYAVYAYDKNGTLKNSYVVNGVLLPGDKGVQISGDGTRLLLVSFDIISAGTTSLSSFSTVNY